MKQLIPKEISEVSLTFIWSYTAYLKAFLWEFSIIFGEFFLRNLMKTNPPLSNSTLTNKVVAIKTLKFTLLHTSQGKTVFWRIPNIQYLIRFSIHRILLLESRKVDMIKIILCATLAPNKKIPTKISSLRLLRIPSTSWRYLENHDTSPFVCAICKKVHARRVENKTEQQTLLKAFAWNKDFVKIANRDTLLTVTGHTKYTEAGCLTSLSGV